MKGKLKIIAATFVATTAFWCLAIVIIVMSFGQETNVDVIHYAATQGFSDLIAARNTEPQPVTFTVTELPTNQLSSDTPKLVLLERELPPQGVFWIGIKQTKPGSK
jgi:hypothetical protein